MVRNLKVGVMGAGAIGCFVGGKLAALGVDVVFIGRSGLQAELEAAGLDLTDLDGGHSQVKKEQLKFATATPALADVDVVLFCVKSGQTADVGAELAGVLRPGTVVVSMQNGVKNAEVLREKLPGKLVLGGIVGFNVVWQGNGALRRTTSGPLGIEWSADPRVQELTRVLKSAGFVVELPKDIRPLQWTKLLMNLNNALSALTDAPTPDLLFQPGYRRVVRATLSEALGILRAAGIRTGRLADAPIPVSLFPFILRLPAPLLRVALRAQLKIDPQARSSMWEDLSKRRLTEVEYLNGEIVRLAESLGLSAPLNRRMVELVHEAEKKAAGSPKLSADALWVLLGTKNSPT